MCYLVTTQDETADDDIALFANFLPNSYAFLFPAGDAARAPMIAMHLSVGQEVTNLLNSESLADKRFQSS